MIFNFSYSNTANYVYVDNMGAIQISKVGYLGIREDGNWSYNATKVNIFMENLARKGLLNFVDNFSGGWYTKPFGIPFCIYSGLLFAYVLMYAFGPNEDKKAAYFWFAYFGIPFVFGLFGALKWFNFELRPLNLVGYILWYFCLLITGRKRLHDILNKVVTFVRTLASYNC